MAPRSSRDPFAKYAAAEEARKAAGQVDGRHFSSYVPEVKALLKAGDDDVAAGLLIRLVEAVEREGAIPMAGSIAAPTWFHDHLQRIYRRRGQVELARQIGVRRTNLQARVESSGRVELERLRQSAAPQPEPRPASDGQRAWTMPPLLGGILALIAVGVLAKACS